MTMDPFRPPKHPGATRDVPTAGQVWRHVPIAQRQAAATAFWNDREASAQQAEAIEEMARLLKFRPKSLRALPVERKIRQLTSLVSLSNRVASQVLVVYHLAAQRPMMSAFLDALGIAHESGVIAAPADLRPQDERKLRAAVDRIVKEYPKADVELYLATLLTQDAEVWGGLAPILEELRASESVAGMSASAASGAARGAAGTAAAGAAGTGGAPTGQASGTAPVVTRGSETKAGAAPASAAGGVKAAPGKAAGRRRS